MDARSHTLHDWLDSRRRSYSDGLSFFRLYASADEKRKYLSYFESVDNAPEFDSHHTILYKRLSKIAREQGGDIRLYESSVTTESFKQTVENDRRIMQSIKDHERLILSLEDQLSDMDGRSGDAECRIDQVESEIERVNESIGELKQRLSSRGAKIVTWSGLPEHLQASYKRIRKITPLYAALFTEMQNESIGNGERLKLAEEVYGMWKERRDKWKEIDRWAAESGVTLDLSEETRQTSGREEPDEEAVRDRMERLGQNIRRTRQAIEKHRRAGKLNYLHRAEQRLSDFTKELNELKEKRNAGKQ